MRNRIDYQATSLWLCISQPIFIYLTLYRMFYHEDDDRVLRDLLISLYVEKIYVTAFKQIDRITATNPSTRKMPMYDLTGDELMVRRAIFMLLSKCGIDKNDFNEAFRNCTSTIESNYSNITQLIPDNMTDIPAFIMRYLPNACVNKVSTNDISSLFKPKTKTDIEDIKLTLLGNDIEIIQDYRP